jgi:hypothetical protein
VLPFVNVSGDTEIEYLSDGISESIINRLATWPRLRVVPRRFADHPPGIRPGGRFRQCDASVSQTPANVQARL